MSTIEILNAKSEEIKAQEEHVITCLRQWGAIKELDEQMFLYETFNGVFGYRKDLHIHKRDNYIYFRKFNQEDEQWEEIYKLILSKNWSLSREKDGHFEEDEIELSYYTTRCISESEIDRLALLGKTAEYLLTNKNELIEYFNQREREHNNHTKSLSDKLSTLRTELNTVHREIETIKKDQQWDDFRENGLHFGIKPAETFDEQPPTVRLEVRQDDYIGSVYNVEYKGETASGKSIDLVFHTTWKRYVDGEYVVTTHSHERRVRREYVQWFFSTFNRKKDELEAEELGQL